MRHFYLFIISFITTSNFVFSQHHFIPHNVTRGSYPCQIVLADIDDDNDQDILTVYYYDQLLACYKNNGIGSFETLDIIYDTSDGLVGLIYFCDINNDGNGDIITAGTNTIYWNKNIGGGSFFEREAICTNLDIVTAVIASDLDNDSLTDIVSASYGDSTLAWYKNLGNGAFGSPQIISTNATWVYSINATDFDLDGKPDILFGSYDADKIAWHKNLGGGLFGAEQIINNAAYGVFSTMTADLDNDSLPDVISCHASGINDKLSWHKNLGNGNFSTEYIINDTIEVPRFFYPADFDNDNDIDIVMTSWTQDTLVWQENLGNGVFGSIHVLNNCLDGAYGVYAADLNGDGAMDIVAGGQKASSLEIYMNHGTGLFDLTQTIANATDDVRDVYSADIDNDGQKDILSASHGDNKVAWYKNLGNKQFSLQKVISDQRMDTRSVYPTDIDNDGSFDVLSSAWEDTLAWHKNDGSGNFNDPIKIPNTPESSIVIAKDLDNDGLDDLICTMGGMGNALYMAMNLGNGSYGSLQLLYSLVAINSVDVNDLNYDGYQDIVLASSSSLVMGINDGTGNFPTFQTINSNIGAQGISLSDLNGDGHVDILHTTYNVNTWITQVGWYQNDGLGNFISSTFVSEIDEISYIIAADDIDNDGDMDIITAPNVTNVTLGNLIWFENLGSGSFGPVQDVGCTGGKVLSLHINDLDNDNDQDIVVALNHKDNVKWLENPLNNLQETRTICAEDSTHIFGNWVSQPGDYADTLQNSLGGDSVVIVRLENYQTYFPTDTVQICQGETYNFHGQLLDTTGLYHATFQSIHGCDSIEELPLVLIPAPEVSVSSFVPDSVSIDTGFIDMPGATPTGGYYMGTGVTTYGFNSTFAGLGEHWITYTYTDTITGCTGMDSTLIKVYDPIGINEIEAQNIKLYPNPGTGDFVLTGTALESVRISSLDGELVKQLTITNPIEVRFSLKGQAKGTYLLHILNDGVEIKRILVLI